MLKKIAKTALFAPILAAILSAGTVSALQLKKDAAAAGFCRGTAAPRCTAPVPVHVGFKAARPVFVCRTCPALNLRLSSWNKDTADLVCQSGFLVKSREAVRRAERRATGAR
jgi:hypothetical protein